MQIRNSRVVSRETEYLSSACIDDIAPADRMIARERDAKLLAGLARLGDLDRATLRAFYVEGQSLNEMSHVFAAPLGTNTGYMGHANDLRENIPNLTLRHQGKTSIEFTCCVVSF